MRTEFNIEVDLTLVGPVLTKGTHPGAFGTDAVAAKNANGDHVLPATLIRGKLREAWRELDIERHGGPNEETLFGHEPRQSERTTNTLNQSRGELRIDEFIAGPAGDPGKRRYRVRIDKDTRAADPGAYIVAEMPYAPGELVTFKGKAQFLAENVHEAQQTATFIQKALFWAGNIGSSRTIGFGRIERVSVAKPQPATQRATIASASHQRFHIQLTFDRPFCFAKKRPNDTLFETEDFVSGANIKGATATTWARRIGADASRGIHKNFDPALPHLSEHFARIRFMHALPVEGSAGGPHSRPTYPPLSTVTANGKLYDVALIREPQPIEGKAPKFMPDWKDPDWMIVSKAFGRSIPSKTIRVRTKIDPDRRKAQDGMLFAQETVVPDRFIWVGGVDLSGLPIDAVDRVRAELLDLLSYGIRDLGKTKANVTVAVDDGPHTAPPARFHPVEGKYVLTLQTPAILCSPEQLDKPGDPGEILKKAYTEYFKEACSSLELEYFYAQQTMAGGYYLFKKFQQGPYIPYVLTNAGSVFVFKGTQSPDALKDLQSWVAGGLPAPGWLLQSHNVPTDRSEQLWRHCPYIRQNGYGEVALNLAVHAANKPKEEVR